MTFHRFADVGACTNPTGVDKRLLTLQNKWTNRDVLPVPLLSLLRVHMLLHVYAADDRQVRTLLS